MFEKCITCDRIGESCVPNLLLLPFQELIKWCDKRQKHLGWSNQKLADKTGKVPVGTINRIKASEEDCKFSTMQYILLALIGGTTDEFSCTEQVEKELRQLEELEKQTAKLQEIEKENKQLKEQCEYLRQEDARKAKIIDKLLREV